MYFLQKDDIMLHFTLTESSDITGCQSLSRKYKIEKLREIEIDNTTLKIDYFLKSIYLI